MGCDIHAIAEVWKDGRWQAVTDEVFPSSYREGRTADPYDGRNYGLFAILADVRNGYGFAGVPTGSGYVPIVAPRGVPDDASPEYRESVAHWDVDGHSHSWITLRELLDYDWDRTTLKFGVFGEGSYVRFLRTGTAGSYASSVSGGKTKIVTPEEYEAVLGDGLFNPPAREAGVDYFIRTQWEETYREAAGFDRVIEALKTLGEPDDVRLVFFFDN